MRWIPEIYSKKLSVLFTIAEKEPKPLVKIISSVKQYFGSHPADLFQKKVFYNQSMYEPIGAEQVGF